MKSGTRLARALAPAFLAAMGLALVAFPAFADDGTSGLTGVVNVNTATVEELQKQVEYEQKAAAIFPCKDRVIDK